MYHMYISYVRNSNVYYILLVCIHYTKSVFEFSNKINNNFFFNQFLIIVFISKILKLNHILWKNYLRKRFNVENVIHII